MEVSTPGPEDIKGLRFVKKVKYTDEGGHKKTKKQYIYEMDDGSMYTSDTKIDDVEDLTNFNEMHPRFARIVQLLQGVGIIFSFIFMLPSIFLFFL